MSELAQKQEAARLVLLAGLAKIIAACPVSGATEYECRCADLKHFDRVLEIGGLNAENEAKFKRVADRTRYWIAGYEEGVKDASA